MLPASMEGDVPQGKQREMSELDMSVPVVRQPRGPGASGDRGFLAERKSSIPEEVVVPKEEPKPHKSKQKQKQNKQNQQAKSNPQDGLQLAHNLHAKERTSDVLTADNKDKEFADMLLSEPVLAGLKNAGFLKPSPIQLAAIPLAKVGFDLIVQSKSGTGKTAVYVVTALEMMQVDMQALQVLVIAPTREIATQGATVAMQIGAALPDLKMSAFIGGINVQEDKIKLKTCQMAVGTPGRLKQLLEEGFMQSSSIRLVCLDEADKLLEPSFLGDTTAILNLLPVNKQVVALSATYPDQLSKIAERFMRSPHHVRLGKECQVLAGVAQYVLQVEQSPVPARQNSLKHAALLNVLSSVSYSQCLVFSNYQVIAQSTADYLNARGFPAIFISAGQDQQRRLQAISTFKKFNCRILCSTDLTARGIDAQNVNLVINLDVPWDHNTYLHRIGRGGRYGSLSVAISLAAKGGEMMALQRIVTRTGSNIRVLEEDIPKDLRAVKTKDLPVLEGVPVDENEDSNKKSSFKHKESEKDQHEEGEKKSGKVKRRGKKKGKVNVEEVSSEANDETVKDDGDNEKDELLDNVDAQSDETLTSAYDLLQKHLAVKQNRNLEKLPSFDRINDLVKATVEGKSVQWNFVNETDETKDDNLKEEIGKAARFVAEHNKKLIQEKHNVAIEKMRNCNLTEMVEKLLAGENINVEPEPTKVLKKTENKPIASMDESNSNTDEDGTSDSDSDSSESSSSSDSSSSESSSSEDEQSTGPRMPGYPPQMPGYPSQMPGYPSQIPGYPPQIPGYPPQMPGYPPQMPGYPPQMAGYPPQMAGHPPAHQMAGYDAWYQQWAASVKQQRDYIQYCHYWHQMQTNQNK